MIVPVILAGGYGTRLWPSSREKFPKQFISAIGQRSLLEGTIDRVNQIECEEIILVCNEEHRFIAKDQSKLSRAEVTILLEPTPKNTAPAICLAANYLQSKYSDDVTMLILCADHHIADTPTFVTKVLEAEGLAERGFLVTFGVTPENANTGFGYISAGKKIDDSSAFYVERFIEKPAKERAVQFLKDGGYYWNSGMFVFRKNTFLEQANLYCPTTNEACRESLLEKQSDGNFMRFDELRFSKCESESIDYAIMEHTKDAVVLPLETSWSDVGSWPAIWDLQKKDRFGNVKIGDVLAEKTKDCLINATDRLVVCIGLNDLTIVDTTDALLVSSKSEPAVLKELVASMRSQNRSEVIEHRTVHRPWGRFVSLENCDGHQVKRIIVHPHEKLSLQKHQRRSEHWVVIAGVATVHKDGEVFELNQNESTFIPVGMVHSLENRSDEILEVIEVQTGDYLGEDDIIRLEDKYSRS